MKRSFTCLAVLLAAGCASRPASPPVVAVAPAPVAAPALLPPGATPGMLVPAALADGSFPTPNQRVSAAAALWHLRAGLNVAALSCPGEQGATITAGYNALLAAHRAELKAAEATYAAEYRGGGAPDWRDRYDNAMTRLYNFFSQTPVRPAFCAAAAEVLGQAAAIQAPALASFAVADLPLLDRPFVDFYRAYDAWRQGMARPVIAVSAASPAMPASQAPVRPLAATPSPAAPPPAAPPRAVSPPRLSAPPRLDLDLSTLPVDPPSGS